MKTEKTMRTIWLATAIVLLGAIQGRSQVSTSSITGTLTDKTGAVVPGAKVTAVNEATGTKHETTTTGAGAYVFPSLVVGSYTISVEATGFKRWISTKNILNVGAPLVVEVTLDVGEVTSVVQVESTYERLATTNAMLSDVVDRRAIRDLPLNGRNPLNLIILEPGLVQRSNGNAGSGTHVNGSRDRAFNVTLDGIDINEPSVPNPQSNVFRLNTDNVQEYRIVTQSPTAEYGRNSGANITLASRGGTNEIHGTLYDYFRNPVLNANDWFNNLKGIQKPNFKINQFGAELGGPIFKDKTFWFASWQGQRLKFTQSIAAAFGGTPLVYSTSARQDGKFRYVSGTVNGVSRNSGSLVDKQGNLLKEIAVCGGNVTTNCVATYDIKAKDPDKIGLDKVMSSFFNAEPAPNDFSTGDGLNTAGFTWNPPSSQPEERFLGKVDHQFNQNNSIFVRYLIAFADTLQGDFLNNRPQVFPNFPPRGTVSRRPSNLAVSYRRAFSPRLVNEFTTGYGRFLFDFAFGRANPAFPNIPPFDPINVDTPFNNQSGTARWLTTTQFIDNLSYTRGAHIFRGGLNFRYIYHNDQRSFIGGVNNAPRVGFSGVTRTPGSAFNLPPICPSTGASPCISSDDIGTLRNAINELLGLPATLSQSYFTSGLGAYTPSGLYIRGARFHQYDSYFQDEWKVRRNLTLNLGVRWEWNRPGSEANGLILRPQPAIVPGATGPFTFTQRDTFWDRENAGAVAPRIGIAWDPFSNGKTVVRAGYAIAFDTISTFQMVPVLGLVPGSSANCTVTISGSAPPTVTVPKNCPDPGKLNQRVAGGFPLVMPPATAAPSSFTSPQAAPRNSAVAAGAIDPNLQSPTVHEWNLSVQRDLGREVILQVAYVGKRATHLLRAYNLNQLKVNHDNFLGEFVIAQRNLAVCGANETGCKAAQGLAGIPSATQTTASFANWGLPGQAPVLLLSSILGANTTSAWRNSSLVTDLGPNFNAAGDFAAILDNTFFNSVRCPGTDCIPGVVAGTGRAAFFRPFPQFGSLFYLDSGGDSYYHALQIQVRRQERNLSFGASYTFAKSIDNMSVDPVGAVSGGAVGNNSRTPTDIYNFNVDRGRSDFDRTQLVTGFFLWDLPFGRNRRWAKSLPGALNHLIGGWSVTGLTTIMSGEPFSVLSGRFTNGNIKSSRADLSGPPPDTGVFFNVPGITGPTVFPSSVLPRTNRAGTPFKTPPPGSNGNQGRNIFNGPNFFNMDLGLTKQFDLTEQFKLQFRADFFNAFNHPDFDNPLGSTDGNTNIASVNFARTCCRNVSTPSTTSLISIGEANRVIQFALRLSF